MPTETLSRVLAGLCEVKFASESGKEGTFSGYAAVFGNVDSYGDVIEKGAFKGSLREWEEKGKLPPMLLQHGSFLAFGDVEADLPIGQWTSMEENSKGLKVEGRLFALSTDKGTYLYEGMKAGSIDGISIGYKARRFTMGTKAGEPRRILHEVHLNEASIVLNPANDKARVGSVKAVQIDDIKTLSGAEAFLREAGGPFSKSAARDFVSRLSKIARREAGDDQHAAGLLESVRAFRRQIVPTQ